MNLAYTNKNYSKFLKRYLKNTPEFVAFFGYNSRNFRRWLFGGCFPRPPMISLLNRQISQFYKIPLKQVIQECDEALYKDYKDFLFKEKP